MFDVVRSFVAKVPHHSAAISTSITSQERLEAIQKACDSFHHDSQTEHDKEMAVGADAAIVKHLVVLVYNSKYLCAERNDVETESSLRHEISLTLDAMESLYRASSSVVATSFQRMGTVLMHLLIAIITDETNRRKVKVNNSEQQKAMDLSSSDAMLLDEWQIQRHDSSSTKSFSGNQNEVLDMESDESIRSDTLDDSDGDQILRYATKILGHCARAGEDTKPMAFFPGLLKIFLDLITLRPCHIIPWEARLSALWTVANLACNAEIMLMMVSTPGLVDALVEIACRPINDCPIENAIEVLRSRSISSRAILNLSWKPECKIMLSSHSDLLDLLATLLVQRTVTHRLNRSRTVQDILVTTRRHAAGALRNLAAASRQVKIQLCNHKAGHLLNVLTDAALNDVDSAVQDRAFATIHNLAIHDTAEIIINHPALVFALKDAMLSSDDDMNRDPHSDGSPKEHASRTLLVLERSITPFMKSYNNLKELLDAINSAVTSEEKNESDNAGTITAV